MQLSQPTLEPHSLCYTCWVQVVYSLLPLLYFFPLGYATAAQFLPTRGSSPGTTRSTRTSRHSSPSQRPCGALLPRASRICFYASAYSVSDIFVINVINNIRISIYYDLFVICAVIHCSFYCIYVWLDPGTYMIARFMSFYKPGVAPKENLWIVQLQTMNREGSLVHLHLRKYQSSFIYSRLDLSMENITIISSIRERIIPLTICMPL